jgi:hypothetical protein
LAYEAESRQVDFNDDSIEELEFDQNVQASKNNITKSVVEVSKNNMGKA